MRELLCIVGRKTIIRRKAPALFRHESWNFGSFLILAVKLLNFCKISVFKSRNFHFHRIRRHSYLNIVLCPTTNVSTPARPQLFMPLRHQLLNPKKMLLRLNMIQCTQWRIDASNFVWISAYSGEIFFVSTLAMKKVHCYQQEVLKIKFSTLKTQNLETFKAFTAILTFCLLIVPPVLLLVVQNLHIDTQTLRFNLLIGEKWLNEAKTTILKRIL